MMKPRFFHIGDPNLASPSPSPSWHFLSLGCRVNAWFFPLKALRPLLDNHLARSCSPGSKFLRVCPTGTADSAVICDFIKNTVDGRAGDASHVASIQYPVHASTPQRPHTITTSTVPESLNRFNMLKSRTGLTRGHLCGVYPRANVRSACRALHACSTSAFHQAAAQLRRSSLAARKGGEGSGTRPGKSAETPPPSPAPSKTGMTSAAQLVAEIVASPLFYLVAGKRGG